MSKRRKFFHWILVVFFVMFAISGFAVGSVTACLLNLLLAAIALPFGTVSELTGMRRVAKWIVPIILMCICLASLARSSSRAGNYNRSAASAGTGSTINTEKAAENVVTEQTSVAATTVKAATKEAAVTEATRDESTADENTAVVDATAQTESTQADNDQATEEQTRNNYDALQTIFIDLTTATTQEELLQMIQNGDLSYTQETYNGSPKTIKYKIAFSDGVAAQPHADSAPWA